MDPHRGFGMENTDKRGRGRPVGYKKDPKRDAMVKEYILLTRKEFGGYSTDRQIIADTKVPRSSYYYILNELRTELAGKTKEQIGEIQASIDQKKLDRYFRIK